MSSTPASAVTTFANAYTKQQDKSAGSLINSIRNATITNAVDTSVAAGNPKRFIDNRSRIAYLKQQVQQGCS